MPAKSAAQERLMQGVAHNPEFARKVGIPQRVGKEFVDDQSLLTPRVEAASIAPSGSGGRAAGIMFLTDSGETLLLRRGDGGDYPNTFGLAGGHQEHGETLEQCARREAEEETGMKYSGKLELIQDNGQFATYLARIPEQFPVHLCDESTGYVWCKPSEAPQPLHPAMNVTLRVASAQTEYDVAQLMAEGLLSSPQVYANMHLLALRITGTGLAYRSAIGEHVWRDASLYLNDEFLKRCNGLMVIMDHPEGSILTGEEFKKRAIGAVMLPYIRGDEVWGIARIYDEEAMNEICEGEISTSPSVVFDDTAENTTLKTEEGEPLLIEGKAFLLDHIAIVTKERGSRGVWDKGGAPTGVELNNPEVIPMTDAVAKADAASDKLDQLLSLMTKISARVDELENMPAAPLVKAADKKHDDDDSAHHEVKEDDEEAGSEVKMDDEEAFDHHMSKAAGHHLLKAADKKRKDAEGSNPVENALEGEHAGEMRPDDDDLAAEKEDEKHARMDDYRAKADSVLAAFGKSASRPLQGEGVTAYRKRLLRGLQGYSDAYKGVNLRSISDAKLLEIAEKQIYADAMVAAKSPVAYGDALVEHRTTDRAGRTISTFTGKVSAWLDQFKVEPMRVVEFRTHNVNR